MAIQEDGHATLITFAEGAISFEEKEVTPPGISGGGPNDITTMHNTDWRTRAAKKLKTLTTSGATVAYDPECYVSALAQINVNQEIMVTFPDGETVTFWGWLDEFIPNPSKEGEQPTAEIKIEPSNRNASGTETAPESSETTTTAAP